MARLWELIAADAGFQRFMREQDAIDRQRRSDQLALLEMARDRLRQSRRRQDNAERRRRRRHRHHRPRCVRRLQFDRRSRSRSVHEDENGGEGSGSDIVTEPPPTVDVGREIREAFEQEIDWLDELLQVRQHPDMAVDHEIGLMLDQAFPITGSPLGMSTMPFRPPDQRQHNVRLSRERVTQKAYKIKRKRDRIINARKWFDAQSINTNWTAEYGDDYVPNVAEMTAFTTCPVCRCSLLNRPQFALFCGHRLCATCLHQLFHGSNGDIKKPNCSSCRQRIELERVHRIY